MHCTIRHAKRDYGLAFNKASDEQLETLYQQLISYAEQVHLSDSNAWDWDKAGNYRTLQHAIGLVERLKNS